MINLGLVGYGGYGWVLAKTIKEASEEIGCRLVAAADARPDLCKDRAAQLQSDGVELYTDALEMLEKLQGRCDAIYLATSIHSHMPLAVATAKAGYHLHLEKPPAATVQEVDAMRQAVADNNRMCLVGFQSIHSDAMQFLKERIVSGKLGKIRRLVCYACWPRAAKYYERNEWAAKLRVGDSWVLDGPAMNALAHQTNNMLFLASAKAGRFTVPVSVRAELYTTGSIESHNTAAIEVRTDEGPTTYFIASHATQNESSVIIRVEGDNGQASCDMFGSSGGVSIRYNDGSEETCPHGGNERIEMVSNLVDAIRNNDPSRIRCDLDDGRNMVLALDGAHESSGKIHRIPAQYVRCVDEGTDDARSVVEGLDDYIAAAAEKGCLLSDLDSPPGWAVATEAFDLTDYEKFPQRFSCD